ncbi:MAG: CopG family transcriptional regulator [Nitriliruptor sp.]|uniref:CopG family transcriptional regulator n=1 Tax=Nitriliruptor sp. TaxID=2448056 RepID=UPI00349FFC6F
MRTTLKLDDDVAAEVERLRRHEGLGLSEAVNRLIREGLSRPKRTQAYVHEARPIGLRVDVTNVAEVLDLLEDE